MDNRNKVSKTWAALGAVLGGIPPLDTARGGDSSRPATEVDNRVDVPSRRVHPGRVESIFEESRGETFKALLAAELDDIRDKVRPGRMNRRWMRFNYMDPLPLLDQVTGKKTGHSVFYLRAIRSDNFLYQVSRKMGDIDMEQPGAMEALQRVLRSDLEPYLEDNPTHVQPITIENPYMGCEGWMEATIN